MFWQELWNSIKNICISFYQSTGLKIVYSIAYLVLGLLLIRFFLFLVKKITLRSKLDNSAGSFIVSLTKAFLYIVLIIIMASALGLSTAGIIAAFSAVAVAVALALKDSLSSLANGVIIIFTKPFKAGDFVEINGKSGSVKSINLFNTHLLTPDNVEVIVPNNDILSKDMYNYSTMPLRRVEIKVPVPYGIDIERAKSIVVKTLKSHPKIVISPEPVARLIEYGDSSLTILTMAWTPTSTFLTTKFDLLEKIYTDLGKENIEIPFNQLDVHIIDQPTSSPIKPTKKEILIKSEAINNKNVELNTVSGLKKENETPIAIKKTVEKINGKIIKNTTQHSIKIQSKKIDKKVSEQTDKPLAKSKVLKATKQTSKTAKTKGDK